MNSKWFDRIPDEDPVIDFDNLLKPGRPDFWGVIEHFKRFNTQHIDVWNTNDLLFMDWMVKMFPHQVGIQCPGDVRAKIGILACRHAKLVGGDIFITLEEKEEELKKITAEKFRKGKYETPSRNAFEPIDNETMTAAIVRAWQNQAEEEDREMARQMHKLYEDEFNSRLRGKHSILNFTLDQVMWEMTQVIRDLWIPYNNEPYLFLPSQDNLDEINHLGNKSLGFQQGAFLTMTMDNWLPVATHIITHLYLEYSLLKAWPIIEETLVTEGEIKVFNDWVADRFSRDIPQVIFNEMREHVCAMFMPAGARSYCRRFQMRANIPEDVICQITLGTNPTAEILSAIEDEIKIQAIANDPSHDLFDAIACCALAWATQENKRIEFDTDILLCNSDLIDCYKTLLMTELFEQTRRPLICNIDGWKVQHDGKWYKTDTFARSWILWLKLIRIHHNSRTSYGYNILYWVKQFCT